MRINVLPLPHPESTDKIKETTVVVIDVLRASSTILEALSNGATGVIPVAEPELAIQLKQKYPGGSVLLSGERMGIKIEGFDIGNSPSEFSKECVSGKIVIMCSTNGTKTIQYASIAREVAIGCFRNLESIVRYLLSFESDIFLIGSGKLGGYCIEDVVCAGAIIDILMKRKNHLELSDSAISARILYSHYKKDLLQMLKSCEHGRYLESIGFSGDLDFCAQLNRISHVPKLANGILK